MYFKTSHSSIFLRKYNERKKKTLKTTFFELFVIYYTVSVSILIVNLKSNVYLIYPKYLFTIFELNTIEYVFLDVACFFIFFNVS